MPTGYPIWNQQAEDSLRVQRFVATTYGSYLWCGKLGGQGGDQFEFTVKEVSEVDWTLYSYSVCKALDLPSSVCKSCHNTDDTLSLHLPSICSEKIDLGDCQVSRYCLQPKHFREQKKAGRYRSVQEVEQNCQAVFLLIWVYWLSCVGLFILPQPASGGSTATPWMLNAVWSALPTACPTSQGLRLVPAMQVSTEHLRKARTLPAPVSCTQKERTTSIQAGGWTYWEQHYREELGGSGGWKTEHELAVWAGSPESQALSWTAPKACGQQGEGGNSLPPLCSGETFSGGLHPGLGPPVQVRHWIRSRGGP